MFVGELRRIPSRYTERTLVIIEMFGSAIRCVCCGGRGTDRRGSLRRDQTTGDDNQPIDVSPVAVITPLAAGETEVISRWLGAGAGTTYPQRTKPMHDSKRSVRAVPPVLMTHFEMLFQADIKFILLQEKTDRTHPAVSSDQKYSTQAGSVVVSFILC